MCVGGTIVASAVIVMVAVHGEVEEAGNRITFALNHSHLRVEYSRHDKQET